MLAVSAAIVVGYLLGSISPSVIAGRLRGVDVRTRGSGNPGASNTLRLLGWRPAVVVLALDVAKGALAAWLAPRLGLDPAPADAAWLPVAGGAAAVAGHLWPFWLRFRGGKGVATALGVALVLDPLAAVVALAVFVAALAVTRRISVGSMAGTVAFALTVAVTGAPPPTLAFALGFALLVFWSHRSNIRNLVAGTEPAIRIGPRT